MFTLLAQNIQLPGGMTITGPLPAGQFTNLASVVTRAIPIVFSLAGIFLLVFLIWGGLDYMLSMGDPKKAETGKNKITSALIGFIIIFVSYWIVQLIDYIFKIGIYSP